MKNKLLMTTAIVSAALFALPAMADIEIVNGTGTPVEVLKGAMDQKSDGGRIWLKNFTWGKYIYDDEAHTLVLEQQEGKNVIELSSMSASIQSHNPNHQFPTVSVVGDENTVLNVLNGDWSIFSRFAPLYIGTEDSPIGTINVENATENAIYVTAGNNASDAGNQKLEIYGNNISLKTTGGAAITGNEGRLKLVANETLKIDGNVEGYNTVYGGHSDMTLDINQNSGNSAVTTINGSINAAKGTKVNIGLKGEGSSINGNMIVSANGSTLPGGLINLAFGNNGSITGNITAQDQGEIKILADSTLAITGNVDVKSDSKFSVQNVKHSGTITNAGDVNLSGDVDLSNSTVTNNGTINFASGSNLLAKLDGSKVISGTAGTITGNTSLVLDTGADGKSLVLEGDKTAFNFDENSLYDINLDGDTYNIVKKSNEEISGDTGADANQAAAISAVIASGDTGNVAFDAVANTINEQLQSGDAAQVKAALDTVTEISPEVAPVAQSVTTETTTQVFSAIGTRLSGGATAAANQGMSSGDSIFEKGAIWLQTLFNHAKLDDTSKTPGFKADTTGVALGIEKEINDEVKAGIGYAYNDSDIKSYLRKTDVDTHTAFVYGEYKPSDWFVNAMMSYNWSKYDEKTAVANAKYDVDSTALQAMTGYNLFYGNTTVTPEAGLRYIHIDQEAYRNSVGSRISGDKSDILTGVIGATVSQNVELENGSVIKPRARLAFTYDFKHDDSNSVVGLPNGSSYGVRGEALDRFGVETGLGLTAEINDEWEVSADYEYRFRDDYRDHTGLLNFKYKF